jgi:nicotinate-nucleotide adenylyltransferase
MAYLHEKYPEHLFALIMGSDNLQTINKWKNYNLLLERYTIHIYNRPGSENLIAPENATDVRFHQVPLLDISSTFIRQRIAEGHSIRYMVPESVYQFLDGSRLYRQ